MPQKKKSKGSRAPKVVRAAAQKSEAQWQAENDFRDLARAVEIQSDKRRLTRAKRAGKQIVAEEQKALRVKQRVAK